MPSVDVTIGGCRREDADVDRRCPRRRTLALIGAWRWREALSKGIERDRGSVRVLAFLW